MVVSSYQYECNMGGLNFHMPGLPKSFIIIVKLVFSYNSYFLLGNITYLTILTILELHGSDAQEKVTLHLPAIKVRF